MRGLRRNSQRLWAIAVSSVLWVAALPAWAKASAGRFVVSADQKMVYDYRTKLTWQRYAPLAGGPNSAGTYHWAGAKSYCVNNLAGLPGTGWRLPNIRELLSLVDRNQTAPPAIDKNYFPANPDGIWFFWSATSYQGGSSNAWYVDFYFGTSHHDDVTLRWGVRCVR